MGLFIALLVNACFPSSWLPELRLALWLVVLKNRA